MFLDLLIITVSIVLLTVLTATHNNVFSHLKQNAITSGFLFSVIQLMIFITKLDSADSKIPDFYRLIVSVLLRFRPLLVGIMYRIVFGIWESIKNKKGIKETDIKDGEGKKDRFDFSILSPREIEVARLAAKGCTNAQIAECLYISTETVKSHMNSIFEKLGISSRKELMKSDKY